jgi:hypothetical protein
MNDQLHRLTERIEAARKAVLAMESYIAQVKEVIEHLRQTISEAEALVAAGGGPK